MSGQNTGRGENEGKTGSGKKNFVYNDLKERLITCKYAPGTILNEVQLTKEYGVSRTPVREAISRLELLGYVHVLPKKGIYVTEITMQDVLQIFETRIEIEPVCLRLAFPYLDPDHLLRERARISDSQQSIPEANRADMDMHLYLIDLCRNRYLITMMHQLFDDNTRAVIATGQNEVKVHNAMQEHLAILDSLLYDRDIDKSAHLLCEHLKSCRSAALRYFGSEEYRSRHKGGPCVAITTNSFSKTPSGI